MARPFLNGLVHGMPRVVRRLLDRLPDRFVEVVSFLAGRLPHCAADFALGMGTEVSRTSMLAKKLVKVVLGCAIPLGLGLRSLHFPLLPVHFPFQALGCFLRLLLCRLLMFHMLDGTLCLLDGACSGIMMALPLVVSLVVLVVLVVLVTLLDIPMVAQAFGHFRS